VVEKKDLRPCQEGGKIELESVLGSLSLLSLLFGWEGRRVAICVREGCEAPKSKAPSFRVVMVMSAWGISARSVRR